jgi:membrane protease YdiL (CAAX protease family)
MAKRRQSFVNILASFGKIILAFIMAIGITLLLSVITAIIVMLIHPQKLDASMRILDDSLFGKLALLAQILGFIGAAWLMHLSFERKHTWLLGFSKAGFIRRSVEGLLLGFILISLSCGLIWIFGGVRITFLAWNVSTLLNLLWWVFVFIGVAVNEELFTRGYIQGLLTSRFGAGFAVPMSAIVFALMHSFNGGMWNSVVPLVNLLLVGLLFSIARQLSGGLWVSMGMHLTWNFFQGNVYGFKVSGLSTTSLMHAEPVGSTIISGGAFGAEGSLMTSLVLLLGITMVTMYYKKIYN